MTTEPRRSTPRLVVQTNGMGVDSAAWLTAVLRGDIPVDFDLNDLVVVTAMTGDESERTRWAMETHLLPLMRRHRIRYVQLARAGWSETDGVEVLSDSRQTTTMVMRGKVSLSDKMLRAGTIPQQSNRNCSYAFKGFVLDTWLAEQYGERPRRHVVGFAAEEQRRAVRDDGYSRAVPGKLPWYPLIEAGWDRERCLAYLHDVYGIEWPRSCCGFCPFQAGPDIGRLGERWRAEPQQATAAVLMERVARALNPRMVLFGDRSAEDVARAFGLGDAVDAAAAELDARPASIYEIRRIYRRRGDRRRINMRVPLAAWQLGPDPYAKGNDVWRSLRTTSTGTRSEVLAELVQLHGRHGGELDVTPQGARLWIKRAAGPVYPDTEHYYAVSTAGVPDKEREAFAELWQYVNDLGSSPDLLDLANDPDLWGPVLEAMNL